MWTKILLIFFVFSFLFKPDYSFDQDLGRHLKLGEIIWQTKSVPATNLFSYTNPNFPFINTHWLFEVWVYLVSQTAGLNSLLILKLVIYLASVWLILKVVPKETSALLLPAGFIFFHTLRERIELRPEFFSFLFTVSTYYILQKKIKLIYLLPFIQLVWINTHIYFFVGLVLQAIFLLHLPLRKINITIFLLSSLASLLNPHGLAGLLYPLNVTKNYGYTIVENQTMFLLESINFQDPNFIYVKISTAIIVISFMVVFLKKKFDIKNILLAGFGATLALMNVRSFPYLVFLSLPAVLQNFGTVKPNWLTKSLVTIAAVLLILESLNNFKVNQFPNIKFEESGKKAMDFVINNNLPGLIYNNFDIGSYIIYKSYPKYQVFVDGRPEAYPKEFFQQVYIPTQADYSKFKDLEKQYKFKTIIFSITDQTPWGRTFLESVGQDNSWKVVYLDNFMVVLTKI